VLPCLLTSTLLNDWITSPITIEESGLLGSFRSTHFNVEMGRRAGVVLELSFPKKTFFCLALWIWRVNGYILTSNTHELVEASI
jgi:hypothetical protein